MYTVHSFEQILFYTYVYVDRYPIEAVVVSYHSADNMTLISNYKFTDSILSVHN